MPKRNKFNNADIKDSFKGGVARKSDGTSVTDGQINAALARVDQQPIIDAADAAVVAEEWDRKSPINGKTAQEVIHLRNDIAPLPAKVYLIRNVATGKVIMFQPFKPGLGGRQSMVDQAEFDTIREDARSTMANSRASSDIKRAFQAELDKE